MPVVRLAPRPLTTLVLIVTCIGLGSVTAARAQSMDGSYGPPSAPTKAAPSAPLLLDRVLSAAPLHVLSTAEEGAKDQLATLKARNAAGKRPYQVGFPRQLAEMVEVRLTPSLAGKGAATPLSGGYVADAAEAGWLAWGTSVKISGAQRVRLHLAAVHLPAGAEMYVAAPGGKAHAFGLELMAPAGDLWTPSVQGETLNLEIHVPVAALGANSGFNIREAIEIVGPVAGQGSNLTLSSQPVASPLLGAQRSSGAVSSAASAAPFALIPKDDSCLVDSSCETNANFNNIDTYRHAIASLVFTCSGLSTSSDCIAGDEYLCTGSLLNDKASDGTPYFLTANHCIPDQTTATSIEAFFDFFTAKCNGAPPNEDNEPTIDGATLLAGQAGDVTAGSSDFAFLQLTSVPSGRFFLGWNAGSGAVANGTALFRLSHPAPAGEPLPQNYTQYTGNPTFPGCQGLGIPAPNFVYEHAVVGSTAGGSSGSPLMLSNGQVVGQLGGGCGTDIDDDCDTAKNDDYDGAFAVTYPAIQQFLNPSVGPTTPCVANGTTLCIDNNPGDHRFQIAVAYHTSQSGGSSGNGNAIPLSTLGITEGGIFWFFDATNPEMLIKVINACALNNTFWVFYSAGTNVGFTVTVSDTNNGHQKFYSNGDLTAAPPVQDTSALPCS
jgi:lysyl endopeptidase